MTMENKTLPTDEREPDGIITRMIDGKLYKVRIFFGDENADTLQTMYERLLRNRIMTELSKTATCPA